MPRKKHNPQATPTRTRHPVEYTEEQREEHKAHAKQFPALAALAAGQVANSVLFRAPATEPNRYAEMLASGQILPHPSGRFVRP